MHPALAADLFQPFKFGERIGVVVDAQVEVGPFLVAFIATISRCAKGRPALAA